jgi:hypothetical protein
MSNPHRPLEMADADASEAKAADTANQQSLSFFALTIYPLIIAGLCIFAYHLFVAGPMFQEARDQAVYYVADLDTISEAKIVSMLRQRATTGVDLTEDEVNEVMLNFREQLRADLLELSGGAPIFQIQAIINARTNIDNLTPIIAERHSLNLNDSIEGFMEEQLAAQRPVQMNPANIP